MSAIRTHLLVGSEPDAQWRQDALSRIETVRKATSTVKVTGPDGKSLPNVDITATMVKSAFRFGSAVNHGCWTRQSPEYAPYQSKYLENFNTAVFEGDTPMQRASLTSLGGMKWPAWINSQTRSGTLNLTKELLSKNITVRSHNLVWPECGNGHVPDQFCQVLDKNKTAFENVVHDHIVNETQTLNSIGCCEEYDVVNEPYSNTNVLQKLQQGNYPLKLWVNTAASSAATAGRRINDDQLCTGVKAIVGSKGDFYRDLIPSLLANGTKLTGMGCESHVGTLLPGMESILSWFDYFHRLGLNVRVTEFDMQVANETLAAEFMRDFLIAAYSHPAVDGFLMWGFVDR